MPCFHPLEAWRGRKPGPSGKVAVVFRKEDSCGVRLELPCGQCIGCRLERSRQWAVRCMHEASLHSESCFITLTFNDEHLPRDGSLDVRHWQLFAKKLRRRGVKFRFFACGEYGEQLSRPHYHACIFGFDFPDRKLFKESEGSNLYTSEFLDSIWNCGFATVGDVTFESAAYVARYVTKKVTGDGAEEHYTRINEFGEAFQVKPEFCVMSRGGRGKGLGGLGRGWFERWSNEVYPSDEVIVRGRSCKPPRFYDNIISVAEPSVFDEVRKNRISSAKEFAHDSTPARLAVREKCTAARMRRMTRALES